MTDSQRDAALRQMLTTSKHALQDTVRSGLRQGRAGPPASGRDDMEHADDDTRGDLSFALLQMKSEALAQLEAALERLDAGKYGDCVACERPIPRQRLRAMPFAVRCQPCAERREQMLAGHGAPSRSGPMSDVTAATFA